MLNPFKVEFSNAIDERKGSELADASVSKMPHRHQMDHRKVIFVLLQLYLLSLFILFAI